MKLLGRREVDLPQIVGNLVVGDVYGTLVQNFYAGAPPETPALPWRDLPQDRDLFRFLSWRTRLAPMHGRQRERDSLIEWATQAGGVRVRLLSGPGGAGKTRLAAEVAQALRDRGWVAGFTSLNAGKVLPLSASGLLLIVDYPEENRQQLREVLAQLARSEDLPSPLRLLLVSRRDLDWWQEDIDAAHAADVCDSQSVELVNLDEAEMVALFEAAVDRLAAHLQQAKPTVAVERIRAWRAANPEIHALPLFTLAAAIHFVFSPDAFGLGGPDIVRALVRREKLRLDNIGRASGLGEHGASRLTGLATVAGGLDVAAIRNLARPEMELGLPDLSCVVDAVGRLPHWEHDRLPAPTPDIIGAAMLREILEERADMAPRWLWSVIEQCSAEWVDRIERVGRDIATVHGAQDDQLSKWLVHMLADDAERAAVLRPVLDQSAPRVTLDLAVAVGTRQLRATLPPARRANVLSHLSRLLALIGQPYEAVDAIAEAIRILRTLEAEHPDEIAPALAGCLNVQATRLHEVGDLYGALAAMRASMALTDDTSTRAELVVTRRLSNLAAHLSAIGDNDEAVRVTEEAIRCYRTLCAREDGERVDHDLAQALHNLASLRREQSTDVDELDLTVGLQREAVAICERLAHADPRLEHEVATGLLELSACLAKAGNLREAMTAAERALPIAQRLAAMNRPRDLHTLASAYDAIAHRRAEKGDYPGAAVAARRAIEVFQQLAQQLPQVQHQLAGALLSLGNSLRETGEADASLTETRRSLEICEPLANQDQDRFGPLYAMCLNNLALLYREQHPGVALSLAHQGAATARALHARASRRFDDLLGSALDTLYGCQRKNQQYAEALATANQAIGIYRRLTLVSPARYMERLIRVLFNQTHMRLALGMLTVSEVEQDEIFEEATALGTGVVLREYSGKQSEALSLSGSKAL